MSNRVSIRIKLAVLVASGFLSAPLVVDAAPAGINAPQGEAMELKQKDLEIRAKLQRRIDELASDADARRKLTAKGQRRTILCNVCHGVDGIAVQPLTPNLAGQNAVYIVDQFQRFSDGRRNDVAMSDLGRGFTEDDKIKLALYYSSLPGRPSGGGTQAQIQRGKQVYEAACAQCHGADGRGAEGYARLAGQRADYVLKMLKEFRNTTGRRSNPWMKAVTLQLKGTDIDDVAYYIANLP
jgi:cytochrome c553